MPQLAIAREFLAQYAKLDKTVRKRVEETISRFDGTRFAGGHFEKLTAARDPRIRTIRIDGFWRGVVLAPDTGDVYCLITVLPHDKAISYATSRRFSVNHALGVLESRDEASLENIDATLRQVAEQQPIRLLEHIEDKDLIKLGVDAHVLPLVRLLTSEIHLEALQPLLPAPQYDALVALASGMTVEEAWTEISRYLVEDRAPTEVDPDDLVTAMERSPDRVAFVDAPEVTKILAHPFDAWRIFLHPAQRKIAYRNSFSGPTMVTGGAGTGKTVTALHRAACLARTTAAAQARRPILLTTFTTNLAAALGRQLDLLIKDGEERERVEVTNIDKLAYRIVAEDRGGTLRIVDSRTLEGMWAAAARTEGLEQSPAFLGLEWEQIVLAQGLTTKTAYLQCERRGRGVPLARPQRERVWAAIVGVMAELRRRGEWTFLQLSDEAARILAESGDHRYRHVIVDEAQDLHPAQWRLLREAVPHGSDDMFIVGDPHQRIYRNHVSFASLGVDVRGRSRRLTLNYRTTHETLAWAIRLLEGMTVIGLDDTADSLRGYTSAMHGPRPSVTAFPDREAELDALVRLVQGWLADGIESHAIGIAARTQQLARTAQDHLSVAGLDVVSMTAKSEGIRIGTMHRMKGLEFQRVAVIGVEEGHVPPPSAVTPHEEDALAHDQDVQRERCLLYVACTRARDALYVSCVGRPSIFLPR